MKLSTVTRYTVTDFFCLKVATVLNLVPYNSVVTWLVLRETEYSSSVYSDGSFSF